MISKKVFWGMVFALYLQVQACDNKKNGCYNQSNENTQVIVGACGYSEKIKRLLEKRQFKDTKKCSRCGFCAVGSYTYVQKEFNQHSCIKKNIGNIR